MIPLSKDELEKFTPPSLANLAVPPVFLFRPATPRDTRAFQRMSMEEGLTLHDLKDVRDEQKRALRALFSEAEAEEAIAQFSELWQMVDQKIEIPDDRATQADDLLKNLMRHHRPLRVMISDNRTFYQDSPRLTLGLFLMGWSGLSVPFQRDTGMVTIEMIDKVEAEIERLESDGIAAKIAGVQKGVAYMELATHALNLLNLSRGEVGNSPSLSPSNTILNGSTMTPGTANGSFPGSAPSPKTRVRASRKQTAA